MDSKQYEVNRLLDSFVLNAVRLVVDKEPGMFLGSHTDTILFRKYKILEKSIQYNHDFCHYVKR